MAQKNLKVVFASHLSKEVSGPEFEQNMKRMTSPVASLWKTNTEKMFQQSALGTLIRKPNAAVTEALAQKTQALKLMSMDMSSSAAFHSNKFSKKWVMGEVPKAAFSQMRERQHLTESNANTRLWEVLSECWRVSQQTPNELKAECRSLGKGLGSSFTKGIRPA